MNILFLKATFEKMEIKANLTAILLRQDGCILVQIIPSNLFGLANCLSAT